MIEENQIKKRGRKPGFTTGPRPTIYVASSIIDDKLVMERFSSPAGAELSQEDIFAHNENDVVAEFKDKYQVEPECIIGPFYDVKGIQAKTIRKTESVSLSIDNINFAGPKKIAIFKGWQGFAWPIDGKSDVMFFMANKEISPSLDSHRQVKPKATPVLVSSLQFQDSLANDTSN